MSPESLSIAVRPPAGSAAVFWRRVKPVVIGLGLAVLIAQWVRVGTDEVGDFRLHWEFGRRLATGEWPYGKNGLDLPYLPFWALAHVPLTVLPVRTAQVVLVPLFALALVGLGRTLRTLTAAHWPLDGEETFWTFVLAVLLASRFLVRDILECGVNLALVALAWAAVALWSRRREWAGGACLGLAIALKLTPALFLAWFAWKRQWRMVGVTLAITAGLMLSPTLVMGWGDFARMHRVWYEAATAGLSNADPSRGVLGEEPLQNMALRPALARLLITLPPGHSARVDHPWDVELLDLPPRAADRVIKAVLLALLAAVFWRFRAAVRRRDDPALLWECAAVSVLILLYSPLTWGQHCVGVLPAMYLLVRSWKAGQPPSSLTRAALAVYCLVVLVLNREVVGRVGVYLIDSYHLPTWCLVGVLAATLLGHGRSQSMKRADTKRFWSAAA
jgi:hypothetical protein